MIYNPSLDGVRGVAVLMVVCAHFNGLLGLQDGGAYGVDIFFVLSGFLITGILEREFTTTGTISFKYFYARRALRLFPALIVTVTLFGFIDFAFGVQQIVLLLKSAAATLLYIVNWVRAFSLWHPAQFGHTWSLAIEEQFYLIWPFVLLFILRFAGLRTLFVATCALVALLWLHRYNLIANGTSSRRIYNGFDTRADAIFIGAAAALFLRSNIITLENIHRWLYFVSPLAVGILILAVMMPRLSTHAVIALSSAVIIIHLAEDRDTWLHNIVAPKWLIWTGRRSYGIYLYHYPIWYLTLGAVAPRDMFANDTKQAISLFVLLPVTYAMAWASYRYIEQPALRLKDHFRPHVVKTDQAAPSMAIS